MSCVRFSSKELPEELRASSRCLPTSTERKPIFLLSDKSQCIAELKYKAGLFKEIDCVEAIGAAFKSDTIIPDDLRKCLIEAVAPLEDVPPHDQDWHPDSENKVLDLVHPSIYPLVFGQSRILTNGLVGLDDCVKKCGDGMTIPIPDSGPDASLHCWSTRFQWLPTDFEIRPNEEGVK